MTRLLKQLPKVRGNYRENASLKATNWFGVGGAAEVLFKPADVEDLADFMRGCAADIPITVIGVGSNLIVRDGGLDGVVIRLGRGFTQIAISGQVSGVSEESFNAATAASRSEGGMGRRDAPHKILEAGAAALDVHVARMAADHHCAGLEFLSGIPGTIGGALAMNGGAYGREVKDALIEAELMLRSGEIVRMSADALVFKYRHASFPEGAIFTRAWFRTHAGQASEIHAQMEEINRKRGQTQPIRERTGGSTFKNPASPLPEGEGRGEGGVGVTESNAHAGPPPSLPPHAGGGEKGKLPPNEGGEKEVVSPYARGGTVMKAWQLIDAAGCRGLRVGGAQMSDLHCNFMINTGDATAADLEALGEEVRARVLAHSGVTLEWEIKRIGKVK